MIKNFNKSSKIKFLLGNCSFCGGSIISKSHILTAAHCVVGKSIDDITIMYGTRRRPTLDKTLSDKHFIYIKEIDLYDDFNSSDSWKTTSDVAILTLEEPLIFSETVKAICLPSETSSSFEYYQATIAGWGLQGRKNSDSIELLEGTVGVIPNDRCQETYDFIKE